MQAISQNVITQGLHGASKAIDYAATPDNIIYAPEDGTILSYGQQGQPGTVNDAGLALRMQGGSGLHQFAHTQKRLVEIGERVMRGQAIAVMGHTGYTIPAGAAGAHCHWWILRDGVYYYPPSLINETFKKGEDVSTKADRDAVRYLFEGFLDRQPNEGEYANFIGKDLTDVLWTVYTSPEYKKRYAGLVEHYKAWKREQDGVGATVLAPGNYKVK